ncbi:nitrite reductase [NAD(P)H], large subunit [Leptospira broomii serovar Hurstbridge str. 5399]|uniref:Nitrite reductase [NAD(P)H], large subunit n=1 Tax=Leptospira broomii serovar Hurstbridge str. 5399 TaxID=1049789 RepID=T0FFP5_9LEPT|nr:nitrite reductase large subunit NirB [Leptospira broomii]EQA46432.1 nitrite reductase [NAD(P)H], large subunit [Leptospira broomii serovar Hurstbridge str. 5399]
MNKRKLVIIGNGMVGHRFAEKLVEFGGADKFEITILGEEPRRAYDRVHLSEYFSNRSVEDLYLCKADWYRANGIRLLLSEPAISIDIVRRLVTTSSGTELQFDELVFATGSAPFVPNFEGIDKKGIFVYRTIEDLERILEYGKGIKRAAVLGGGLLGLEAAKALVDMGKDTHVVEFATRLMPRQLDEAASSILKQRIEELGVTIHLEKQTEKAAGEPAIKELKFIDGSSLEIDMLVVSAGIRPRDELARKSGIITGERGGIIIDDELRANVYGVYAIGEVALHRNFIYGLVAPGYEMAEALAYNLCSPHHTPKSYSGSDLSTKLKLIGVDVASFGDALGQAEHIPIVFKNPRSGVYKKLVISLDGKQLLGGILVGDVKAYGNLLSLYLNRMELPEEPETLIVGSVSSENLFGADSLPEEAKICSCNNVSKGDILHAIREKNCTDIASLKECSKAGTGCGGCIPQVNSILKTELKAQGKVITEHVCEHFKYSRQELFQIIKVKGLKSFTDVIKEAGKGNGCEICKPAVASILASIWNEPIIKHREIQDTNDKYLANIQKGGTYSIVPRIPGGEITPEKLIQIGEIAKKYDLYCKITGGQRIDLLGAKMDQLPEIWKDLVEKGFESGHAYGKAMRTVKSCVGSTWCRYGVQDSTAFAIRIEERYRGIRAPHKIKSAVSGCIRECAEARGKDFGVIATEKGWNLYVGGNGGVNPKHAILFAEDLDEDTCLRYIDRFLMFYIRTADKLMRTSTWLEQLEGGVDYLKDVIINDRLGINSQLESEMDSLVDTYVCEWKDVVEDQEKQKKFKHFVNSQNSDSSVRFVEERGQKRPVSHRNLDLTAVK